MPLSTSVNHPNQNCLNQRVQSISVNSFCDHYVVLNTVFDTNSFGDSIVSPVIPYGLLSTKKSEYFWSLQNCLFKIKSKTICVKSFLFTICFICLK